MPWESLFSGCLGALFILLLQWLFSEKKLQAYWEKKDVKPGRGNDSYWLHIVNMNARVASVSKIEAFGSGHNSSDAIMGGVGLSCANDGKRIGPNEVIYINPFNVYPLHIEVSDKKEAQKYGYSDSIGRVRFLSNARGNILSRLVYFIRARDKDAKNRPQLVSYEIEGTK